jgi:glycosyltransferase involved in cell wall biosynthesis/ribosomal protein S18 acetylase RimI-like enzyme
VSRPLRVAHVTTVDLTLRFLLLGQLTALRDAGFDVTAISGGDEWLEDLRAERIRHIPWKSVTRAWNPQADGRAFLELLGILKRERFDLVHVHTAKAGVIGRIAARLAKVPCVVDTVHGLYVLPEDPLKKRLAVLTIERLAGLFSDLELYQSEEDLKWSARIHLVPKRKRALLGNGTDLSRFDQAAVGPERIRVLREELGIPEGAPVVGTVGRLVVEKGYREFFEAARRVHASHPRVRFLSLGRIEPEKWDAISEKEIADAERDVRFLGWRADVQDVMALFDVFVLPSWREGLPRSAIEAAAMGKSLVLTDIRGCREVVREGIEGHLVPVRRADRLAAAITDLIEDPDRRAAMGEAARARAVSRFDERQVCDRILDHYRVLLAKKGLGVSPSDEARIRPAAMRDVSAMARLHREIPYAFIGDLGTAFLRVFYRALIADRSGCVFVAEDRSGVVGFIAGTTSTRAFNRRFARRHGVAAVLAAAPALVRPRVLRKALESVRYAGGKEEWPDAELVSIALSPEARGNGLGTSLTMALVEAMEERGIEELRVMARLENQAANAFYRRLGSRPVGTVTVHDGKPSQIWVIECRSSSLSA